MHDRGREVWLSAAARDIVRITASTTPDHRQAAGRRAERSRCGGGGQAQRRHEARNLPPGPTDPTRRSDSMTDSLMQFPCSFPLKVMGRRTQSFRSLVLGIVQKHVGAIDENAIEERPSRDGNYLSLTCTFEASSREQLDALYRELTAHEKVLIVL